MTLDEAKQEVASMVEDGTSQEKIGEIAKLYQIQTSDWRAKMTETEWRTRESVIKSDLLHELLLTH